MKIIKEEIKNFYGFPINSEKADDILFALQVNFGSPDKGFDYFKELKITNEDIIFALDYVVKNGFNKYTYFYEEEE